MRRPVFCKPDQDGVCRFCGQIERSFEDRCTPADPSIEVDTKSEAVRLPSGRVIYQGNRTEAEMLVIITNHCSWCENWHPEREKNKCSICSTCASSNFIEHTLRSRAGYCPQLRRKADQRNGCEWDEASLRKYLGREDEPPAD